MKKDKLKEFRKCIDEIDNNIISLILKRNKIVKKIGEYKKQNDINITDKEREKEVIKNIDKLAKHKNDKDLLKKIYSKLISHSKKEQRKSSKRSK